jgi:hypothetical protein
VIDHGSFNGDNHSRDGDLEILHYSKDESSSKGKKQQPAKFDAYKDPPKKMNLKKSINTKLNRHPSENKIQNKIMYTKPILQSQRAILNINILKMKERQSETSNERDLIKIDN